MRFTLPPLLSSSLVLLESIKSKSREVVLKDLPKDTHYFKDIRFFEEEFDGIMPMEIVVDTKRKNGASKPATLKRMDRLGTVIEETPELSKPISLVNLVKYSKQAFYSGIPKYYQLPTSQENTFIMDVARKSENNGDLLESFVDSTGQNSSGNYFYA